jgi:hypothetical protein
MKRVLLDSQVIYISYAKGNFTGRVSYAERMVRSFNLLRIMENSRVIWNIMNSSFRLKMVVPIGTKSPQKAKESLAEMMAIYKEDVSLNYDSGELTVNGKPAMQFYKNYLFPSKNGEQPEIETIGGDGYDLSDTNSLKYFEDKLKTDSKIPFSRFDRTQDGGSFSINADGMARDEIRFHKFIVRLRSIFQEILIKPVFIQTGLQHPELAEDELFKSALALKFVSDNVFEELKEMDLMEKRANFIQTMMGINEKQPDSTGMMQDVPYFEPKFLIEKYLGLTKHDIDRNEIYKEEAKIKNDAAMKAAQQAGGMGI